MREEFKIIVDTDYLQMIEASGVKILASIFIDADIEEDQAIRLFLEAIRQEIYALKRR